MNKELERLLQARLAADEATGKERERLLGIYRSLLNESFELHPNVRRDVFENSIRIAYHRWLKAQNRHTSLPPDA